MPALGQHADVHLFRKALRLLHSLAHGGGHGLSHQHRQLGQVGGYHGGQTRELPHGLLCLLGEHPISAGRDHYWVQHHHGHAHAQQPVGHGLCGFHVAEHTDLDRIHLHVIEHRLQLSVQEGLRRGVDFPHALSILRHQRRHYRHAVTTSGTDGFQVRLYARSTRRVGAGDR